jgi:hypothetical protein
MSPSAPPGTAEHTSLGQPPHLSLILVPYSHLVLIWRPSAPPARPPSGKRSPATCPGRTAVSDRPLPLLPVPAMPLPLYSAIRISPFFAGLVPYYARHGRDKKPATRL